MLRVLPQLKLQMTSWWLTLKGEVRRFCWAPCVMNAIPYYRFAAFTLTADTDHSKYPRLYVLLKEGVRLTQIQEPINRGSVNGRNKKFFSSPKLPDQLWDLPSFVISWHRWGLPRGKAARMWSASLTSIKFRGVGMSLAFPALRHKPSWHVQGRPNLHMIHNACNTRIHTIIVPTNARKCIEIDLFTQRPPTFFNRCFSVHFDKYKIIFVNKCTVY